MDDLVAKNDAGIGPQLHLVKALIPSIGLESQLERTYFAGSDGLWAVSTDPQWAERSVVWGQQKEPVAVDRHGLGGGIANLDREDDPGMIAVEVVLDVTRFRAQLSHDCDLYAFSRNGRAAIAGGRLQGQRTCWRQRQERR